MFMEPGHGLASFVQRVGRVSRGADDGRVIVSLPEQRRRRDAWTRRVADVVESDAEMNVEAFTAQILRDVRRRLEPTRKQAEAAAATDGATVFPVPAENNDVPFYHRVSWRGAFWAALFIVAVRRTRMEVQKEARERLRQISPAVVRFVEAKIGEIESLKVVNDNLPRLSRSRT